jgi:hypothetical protein
MFLDDDLDEKRMDLLMAKAILDEASEIQFIGWKIYRMPENLNFWAWDNNDACDALKDVLPDYKKRSGKGFTSAIAAYHDASQNFQKVFGQDSAEGE